MPKNSSMETTLLTVPSTKHPLILRSSFLSPKPTSPYLSSTPPRPKFRTSKTPFYPSIKSAISRTKKEETVTTVKENLENCYFLAGIKYKGFTVKQFQELRRTLPENTKLLVAKNTLVFKAIEGTKWEVLKPCMKGMNAWLFVHTEEIPGAIKPYKNFMKEKKLEDNDFCGGVFEGKFYAPEEFKELESMPTRAEVYAKLLGGLQGPATGLVGTLQAPAREVVMVLKAFVQKLEEESGGGGGQ